MKTVHRNARPGYPPRTLSSRPALLLLSALLFSCGGPDENAPPPATPPSTAPAPPGAPSPDEPRPALRLPADVHPLAEALELTIRPESDRFHGKADIDVQLDHPRRSLWLHSRNLHVSS